MRELLIGQCPYCEGNLTNGHKCRQMLETIAIECGEPQPTASGMNSIDCADPVSGPSPATASSAPIEQPMSERERGLVEAGRRLQYYESLMGKSHIEKPAPSEWQGAFDRLREALTAYEGEGK